MSGATKILFVHTRGGIGDLVLSSPVAAVLARCYTPAEVIGWVNPAFRPVLEGHPAFAGFIDLSEKESLWSGAQRLRREGFKIAVFPWSTSRQAWMAALAGIPVRAGQGGRLTYSFLYTHPVAVRSLAGDVTSHWSDIQLDYARVLGCAADAADAVPRLYLLPEEREWAAAFLRSRGVNGDKPVVGIHVCKGLAVDLDRWPVDRFAEVAAALAAAGYDVIFTGTASEAPLVEAARTAAGLPPERSLAGQCTLRQTMAVLSRLAVLVCPDTGTGHLAAAIGVPVVSIFAVKSDIPARWRPTGAPYRIVRPRGFACPKKCVKEKCPRFECLLYVDASEVVRAAEELANHGNPANPAGMTRY